MPRNVQQIVEEQIRRWQLFQEARHEQQPLPAPEPANAITISASYRSRGSLVAQQVGALLDLPVYDREIVEHIAKNQHVRLETVTALDERSQSSIDNYLAALMRERNFNQNDYFQQLTRTVMALWHHGPCVLLGRGAVHILPAEHVLSVRIVAPEGDRIRRCEQLDGVNQDEARKKVLQRDQDREAFIRRYYGRDITDVLNYDLVLNTRSLTTEACARVVAEAYRQRFGAEGVEKEPLRPSIWGPTELPTT